MFTAPTRAQFYTFGLPAKAFVSSPQFVEAVDVGAHVLTVPGHGYTDGDRVRMVVNPGGGGVVAGVLPSPLSPSVLYWVVGTLALGGDMFQLSTTEGGSPVALSDAGTPVFGVVRDVGNDIDLVLQATTATVVEKTIGMTGPFATAPLQVVQWICHLAAFNLAVTRGVVSPEYAADPSLAERARVVRGELDRREKTGKQWAGAIDATPSTTENAGIGWSSPDRGYPCDGSIP